MASMARVWGAVSAKAVGPGPAEGEGRSSRRSCSKDRTRPRPARVRRTAGPAPVVSLISADVAGRPIESRNSATTRPRRLRRSAASRSAGSTATEAHAVSVRAAGRRAAENGRTSPASSSRRRASRRERPSPGSSTTRTASPGREPREDRPLLLRTARRLKNAGVGDAVTHGAGSRKAGGKGALQDLADRREEPFGDAPGRHEELGRTDGLGIQDLEDRALPRARPRARPSTG